MAQAINLRRPRQFPLHQMLWPDFEELIRDIGFKLLGAALSPFKDGPDGGRDARFDGTPIAWPSEAEREKGQYVVQCKHTKKADACCSHEDFKDSSEEFVGEFRFRQLAKRVIQREF